MIMKKKRERNFSTFFEVLGYPKKKMPAKAYVEICELVDQVLY